MQNFRWQQSCLVTAPRPLFPCKRPHRADARSLYPGRGQPVLPACIWRKNRLSRCNPAGSGSDRRSVPLRSCNVRRSGILRLRSIRFLQAVFCSGRCRGLEKPNKFDPFGQKESAHLIYHTIAPLKVLVMGVNFILPF